MSLPELVTDHLDGEEAVARVDLGGEDELVVTPSRTLVYRAEGLLADETVEEYPHDAERIVVDEGRRKAEISLDYGLEGEETVAVPETKLERVLHPVLAGVLNAAGITDAGETVKRTFRFSELTLVVTSARVVKHIGQPVWDEDYEEFHFADVTDLDVEEGSVATSIVLTVDGRQERFKAPNEAARAVREAVGDALTVYHGVGSVAELRARSDDAADDDDASDNVDFGDGPDPLTAKPADVEDPDNATREEPRDDAGEDFGGEFTSGDVVEQVSAGDAGDAEAGSVGESPGTDEADLAAELRELRETVEAQQAQLERQADLIDQLVSELRQGR